MTPFIQLRQISAPPQMRAVSANIHYFSVKTVAVRHRLAAYRNKYCCRLLEILTLMTLNDFRKQVLGL